MSRMLDRQTNHSVRIGGNTGSGSRMARALVAVCLLATVLVSDGHIGAKGTGAKDTSTEYTRTRNITPQTPHALPQLLYDIRTEPTEAIALPAGRRRVWMEVTAYCPCPRCCGSNAHGMTASGKTVQFNGGHFVAADTDRLPFGTHVVVPGYDDGQSVEVIDRGAAIKGNRLDVFFESHEAARAWGRQWVWVEVGE